MAKDTLGQPRRRRVRALGDLLAAAHLQVAPDDDDLLRRALLCYLIHVPYRGFEPRASRTWAGRLYRSWARTACERLTNALARYVDLRSAPPPAPSVS